MWYKHSSLNESSDDLKPSLWFEESLAECLCNTLPTQYSNKDYVLRCVPSNYHVRVCWESRDDKIDSDAFSASFSKSQLAYLFVPIEIREKRTQENRACKFCMGSFPLPLSNGVLVYNHVPRAFVLKLMKRIGLDYKKDITEGHRLRIGFSNLGSLIVYSPTHMPMSFGVVIRLTENFTGRLRKVKLSLLDFIRIQGTHINQAAQESKYAHYFLRPLKDSFEKAYAWPLKLKLVTRQRVAVKATLPATANSQVNSRIVSGQSGRGLYYSSRDFFYILDAFADRLLGKRASLDTDHLGNRIVHTWGYQLLICFYQVLDQFLSTRSLLHRKNRFGRRYRPIADIQTQIRIFCNQLNGRLMDSIYETLTLNPLSQYLDQTNLLAEYIHLHKISSKILGGSRPTSSLRDIPPSSFGRVCPLYTIDGENAGTTNQYAFLARGVQGKELQTVVRAVNQDYPTTDTSHLINTLEIEENPICVHPLLWRRSEFSCLSRFVVQERSEFRTRDSNNIRLFFPQSTGFLAPQVNLIPFLLHDDPTRCLMGANMQRQAVALLSSKKSVVSTGLESTLGSLNGSGIYSLTEGIVTYVSGNSITIRDTLNREVYYLFPVTVSNQFQVRHYYPVVWEGERVFPGQLLVETQGICDGELCLGQNLMVAYASWYGYNYEDAILLNEQLIYERTLTSVDMEQEDVVFNENEELTPYLPVRNLQEVCFLNKIGLATLGAPIEQGTVIIGKVTRLTSEPLVPPDKTVICLRSLLDETLGDYPSLPLANSSVVGARFLSGVLLYLGLLYMKVSEQDPYDRSVFRCILGNFRQIEAGDKLAGRHGNKGVVSAIWPQADLPYTLDGLIPDLIVNPLGVPSRMNVGQILELLLGLTGIFLDSRWKVAVSMENDYGIRYKRNLIYHKLKSLQEYNHYQSLFNPYIPGKTVLRDGRTGALVLGGSVVGVSYLFKMIHMVQDKVMGRSQGDYSEITQQPVRGPRRGGQRFGEMEVWAMEAFGASYELKDLLTIKSDASEDRTLTYQSILDDEPQPETMGLPECWHVLVKSLNSLGIELYK